LTLEPIDVIRYFEKMPVSVQLEMPVTEAQFALTPLRPSYAKMCRQIEAVALGTGKPVLELTENDIGAYGEALGWSPATIVTVTRVASAHGIDVEPSVSKRVRSRPGDLALAGYMTASPSDHPARQRTAALAALCWRLPAPVSWWRKLTFDDIDIGTDGSVTVDGRRCADSATICTTWRSTARRVHPDAFDPQIPFLAKLDESRSPAGERAIQIAWAAYMDGITFDRWRAWAIDAGAAPLLRGLDRHRHR
jgi:hypothetical protein